MWPFHLPAVAVDIGHYLESGVRHTGPVFVRVLPFDTPSRADKNGTSALRGSPVPWRRTWPLSAGSRTYTLTGGGEGVSEGISERAETAVLCLLARLRRGGTKSHFVSPSSDSQCRRTEWHSPSQPPHAHKDFHYGFTVITYTHV